MFSGAGGFELAGLLCGIEPVWNSEIEKYPSSVTAARLPNVIPLGDIRLIDGGKIKPVVAVTFGSPCQDLSNAGSQKGLQSEMRGNEVTTRSGLFFNAIEIIKQMRRATNGQYPRFIVWENVIGAFSSNHGEDFRTVLQEIVSISDETAHVPLPAKGKWQTAGCIMGDCYSIAWRVYDAQYWGVAQRRRRVYLVADLSSNRAGKILFEPEGMPWHPQQSQDPWQNIAHLIPSGFIGDGYPKEVLNPVYCCGNGQLNQVIMSEKTGAINCMHDQQCVLYDMTHACDVVRVCEGVSPTLQHRMGTGGNQVPLKIDYKMPEKRYRLRRLTPLECCRLQGFPDWWTWGVQGSDTAQYKMWGNSIAIPCAVDVLRRIKQAYDKEGLNEGRAYS